MRCSIMGKAYGEDLEAVEDDHEKTKDDFKVPTEHEGEEAEERPEVLVCRTVLGWLPYLEAHHTICLHSQAYIFKDPELKQDVHDTASDPALFFRILGLCHTVLVEQQQLGEEDTVPERKDDEDERGTFRLSFPISTEIYAKR